MTPRPSREPERYGRKHLRRWCRTTHELVGAVARGRGIFLVWYCPDTGKSWAVRVGT